MNEVTKLYKNAEVEPINFAKQGAIDFTNTIEIDGKRYPDFTAEKQLELIKWLIRKNITDYRIINYFEDSYYCLYAWEEGFKESDLFKSYEEALACLFNYLWQDLTEEERKQIRGILE